MVLYYLFQKKDPNLRELLPKKHLQHPNKDHYEKSGGTVLSEMN